MKTADTPASDTPASDTPASDTPASGAAQPHLPPDPPHLPPAPRDLHTAVNRAALDEHAAIVESAESAESESRPAPPRATFFRSFFYAGSGLWHAIRTQRNMRIHLGIAVAALILGLVLRLSTVELAVLVVTVSVVIVAEMVNTVAEACVDLATQEWHPLAKVAKDVAAGAVLFAAILSVIVGLLIFLPHLWPLALRLLAR